MFSLHSQFIESEKYLYLLGSEPWTRRSAGECRGPRTAETDCRKIDGTKAFMTSINDMYTDRSLYTLYEVLLFMEMISPKPIYYFLTQKMKIDQFKIQCIVCWMESQNLYCKLSDMTFDKIRKTQANMVTPIKEEYEWIKCLNIFLFVFCDSGTDIVMWDRTCLL